MAFIRWIIALPFIVGAVLFAVAHPQLVSFKWNPFEEPIEVPLYIIGFMFISGGFLLGCLMTWLGTGALRKERRQQNKKIKELEKAIDEANKKVTDVLSTHKPIHSEDLQLTNNDKENANA